MGVLNFNGALYMATGIDNSGLKRDASEAERIIEGLGKTAQSVGAMMGVAFTLDAAKDFAVKVATVRGEFQKLEVAFKTMLGNKEAADRLMQQLTRTAATTPFGMQEVAGGAKQLLAYGVAAGEVNDTLIRLGNIASGLSIPLNDLVYLYGTTMTQGRLFTQDLRQFMGRGIPIADELAKQFGVTKDKVQDLVTAGKVGFPEVQKALESLTNEGGKFYNLMEEQSKTIAGKMSNLSDAIEMMFNDIGKSQEGVIGKTLDGVTSLVENYKQIGSVLAQLVIAYGTYKAALIAITTAKSAYTKVSTAITEQMAVERRLALSMGKEITESEARQAAQTKLLSSAKAGLVANLKNVATALAPQLYAAAIVAVGALAKALYDMSIEASGAEKAMEAMNRVTEKAEEAATVEKAKIEQLVATIKSEVSSRETKQKALRELIQLNPELFAGITEEMVRTGQATKILQQHTAALVADTAAKQANLEIEESAKRRKAAENDQKKGTSDRPLLYRFFASTSNQSNLTGTQQIPYNAEEQYRKLNEARNKKRISDEVIITNKLQMESILETNRSLVAAAKAREAAGREVTMTLAGLRKEIQDGDGLLKKVRADAAAGKRSLEDVKALEEQQNARREQYRTLTGQSYDQEIKAGSAAYNKHLKTLKKEQKDVAAAMEEIEELQRTARKRIEDAELEMMDEGLQKKLQKIDLTYQREIEEIEEWKKTLEKVNEKATGKKDLTKEQQEAYDISRFNAQLKLQKSHIETTDEWKRKEAEAYDEMLQAFGSYKEKQEAIAREYARKIADAEREGRTNEAEKQRREMIKAQASAAEQELGKDDTLKTFFKHTEKQTLQAAKKARAEIANTIKFLKTKGAEGVVDAEKARLLERMLGDPELVRQTLEGLDSDLEKIDDTIEGIQNQKVFDALIANFKKLRKAASGTGEQIAALRGVINGIGNVGSMISQLGNAMSDCDIKAGKVVSTIGNALTNAASFAAAGASVGGAWGAVAGAVVGAASAIIPAIGKVEEWTDAMEKSYQAQAKWLEKVRDANLDIIKGYGSVEEKVKATTEALQNNAKLLDLIHEKQEAQRNKKADKGDGHSIWYTNRQNVLSMLRGKGAFDNFEDHWLATPERDSRRQIDRMNRYKKYVDRGNVDPTQGWGLIDEEIRKGYRPKIQVDFEAKGIDLKRFMRDPGGYLTENDPQKGALKLEQLKWIINTFPEIMRELDSTTVANINERMELLKKEGETLKDALSEALAGVSFDGLLSDMEGFLKTMENGFAHVGKNIEGHLRDAIVKSLLDEKTKVRLKKNYDKMVDLMKNRETMGADEFKKQMQEVKDDITATYKELREKKREALSAAGLKDYDEAKDNTLRGALAKASQESIDLLAGQMGAVRVTIEQILKLMNESRGKGGGMAEYYDSVRQSFTALYQLQIAGWKEVTVIKEVVQQMHVTQSVVASLSQSVADNTASIKETSRRVAEGITVINNGGVKIKGGGLGL